jgi:hypothetical protein
MGYAPQKKTARFVLTAALALAAVTAETFIFTHLGHDCCGEGCPVCARIEAAWRLLEGLSRAAALVFAAALFVKYARTPARHRAIFCAAALTPVALKTKITS